MLHYVATSTVTFNASAALSRLSSTDGDIAYASLSRQLNISMIDGSFLSEMKSSIPAFINVTTAYIHMLEHKVITVSTSLPIVVPTISQIALIGIAATSTNITVTLTSDAGYISGGSLYCIAMVRGAVPSSAGALKTASSDASSSKGASVAFSKSTLLPLSLNLVIEDLAALQAYGIFCYAETTSGTGTALDVVIRDKVSTSTACCRSVKYTNAPPYVYSDLTKYSQSSRSLFVFSYELPNAPLSALTVTPSITLDGVPTDNVLATPASIDFTSVTSLKGYFVLSASPSTSGDCVVDLLFSGVDSTEYSSQKVTVKLLSSTSSVPAPLPQSARFSDSGQAVVVTFDSPTDRAGLSAPSWPCSTILNLGDRADSSCAWLNATTVSVTFPAMSPTTNTSSSYLNVFDKITVLNDTLRAFCTSTTSVCSSNPTVVGSFVVLAPLKPAAPTVIISAPSKIGSCSNLSIDASGSYGGGGRLFTSVVWSVSTTASVNTTDILTYLNASSSVNQVTIPYFIVRSLLSPGTYTFSLLLTNFLGATTTGSVKTVVSADRAMPLLTILGSAYQIVTSSQILTILSSVTLSSCVPPMPVTYAWAVQLNGQITAMNSTSSDSRTLSLPAYSLTVDKTYTVTVNATAGTTTTSASVEVYVAQGPVTATVKGGYAHSIPLDQELVLDASLSQDANIQQSKNKTLLYQVSITLHIIPPKPKL
jgi:REJ domain